MNILELRAAAHPDLFYRQDWYLSEAFASRMLPETHRTHPPTALAYRGGQPPERCVAGLPLAVELATLYVMQPSLPIWRNWLWCADFDNYHGQRIYVGGTQFEKGLQIHRHLALTHSWGTPVWA